MLSLMPNFQLKVAEKRCIDAVVAALEQRITWKVLEARPPSTDNGGNPDILKMWADAAGYAGAEMRHTFIAGLAYSGEKDGIDLIAAPLDDTGEPPHMQLLRELTESPEKLARDGNLPEGMDMAIPAIVIAALLKMYERAGTYPHEAANALELYAAKLPEAERWQALARIMTSYDPAEHTLEGQLETIAYFNANLKMPSKAIDAALRGNNASLEGWRRHMAQTHLAGARRMQTAYVITAKETAGMIEEARKHHSGSPAQHLSVISAIAEGARVLNPEDDVMAMLCLELADLLAVTDQEEAPYEYRRARNAATSPELRARATINYARLKIITGSLGEAKTSLEEAIDNRNLPEKMQREAIDLLGKCETYLSTMRAEVGINREWAYE